ncbi:MAG: hypothetical protein U1E63_17535 [Burkholderiales bacterium]
MHGDLLFDPLDFLGGLAALTDAGAARQSPTSCHGALAPDAAQRRGACVGRGLDFGSEKSG